MHHLDVKVARLLASLFDALSQRRNIRANQDVGMTVGDLALSAVQGSPKSSRPEMGSLIRIAIQLIPVSWKSPRTMRDAPRLGANAPSRAQRRVSEYSRLSAGGTGSRSVCPTVEQLTAPPSSKLASQSDSAFMSDELQRALAHHPHEI